MENLVIKHKMHTVFRKAIGVLFFISGLLWLFGHIHDMNWFHWLYTIFYTGIGITFFTTAFGSETTEIHAGIDFIKLRWINWLKPRIVQYSEIENITFTMFEIVISRKEKKPLKLKLDFMERDQMRAVRDFFLKLAAERSLNYENRYRG
jgi:phage anti-repressor protein